MKLILVVAVVLFVVASTFVTESEAANFATCRCSGCRPSTFSCDYNTFGGCNCATCRCKISTKPPTRRCCSSKCGWWNTRKCWDCPVARGCNYDNCSCY